MNQMWSIDRSPSLMHHGVKGMKWGVWNAETRARYSGKDRVFISGKVSFDKQLPKKVKDEINQVMKANAQIIVGDAPGADTRVQDYLSKSGYSNVIVFTSEGKARNNVGNWKERNIGKKLEDERARRVQKDIAMTNLATKAIAIMPKDDRPDSAMSKNIDRLKERDILTTLYDFSDDTMNVKLKSI